MALWQNLIDRLVLVAAPVPPPTNVNWAELAGTAITALIAAAVGAYATGHVTRQANARQFRQQQREQDTAAAFSMQQKLIQIYSSVSSMRGDISGAKIRQIAHRSPYLALHFRPFANEPAEVHFSAEELQRIHRIGGPDLLNLVADLDRRYNAVIRAIMVYRDRWMSLTDSWEGTFIGSENFLAERTRKEMKKDAPRLHLLDDLIYQTSVMLEEMVHISYASTLDLFTARGRELGLSERIETITPDGAPVVMQSTPFGSKPSKTAAFLRLKRGQEVRFKNCPLYGPDRVQV